MPIPGRSRRLQIAQAIASLPNSRRARSQVEWLQDLAEDPELALVRSDRRRNVLRVAELLARAARWNLPSTPPGDEMTAWPTWAKLIEGSGLSRSTVADILAWLRRRGRLAVVETGTTARIRAGLLYPHADPHADQGNRAAEYVLCIPQPESTEQSCGSDDGPLGTELGPLPASPDAGNYSHARARARRNRKGDATADISGSNTPGLWKTSVVPRRRRDQLAAAETLRRVDPVLRRLSARYVRHLLAPWWDAGWTPDDVLYAVNHRPNGAPWPYAYRSHEIWHVPGWLRARLSAWLGSDGTPLPSLSQRRAAQAAAAARRQADERARRQAAIAAAADASQPAIAEQIRAVRQRLARLASHHGRLARHRTVQMRGAPRPSRASSPLRDL